MYMHTHVHTHVHRDTNTCIYTHIHTHILYRYIHMYIETQNTCTCTHTHVHNCIRQREQNSHQDHWFNRDLHTLRETTKAMQQKPINTSQPLQCKGRKSSSTQGVLHVIEHILGVLDMIKKVIYSIDHFPSCLDAKQMLQNKRESTNTYTDYNQSRASENGLNILNGCHFVGT